MVLSASRGGWLGLVAILILTVALLAQARRWGAVAWFGGNHVGYVKEVYSDGSFMIEDYNRVAWETYGKQIFAPGSIPYFLYPPG